MDMVKRLAFPAPRSPKVWSGRGLGGWRVQTGVRGCWSCSWKGGQASQTRPGSYASSTQAMNPIT